MLVKLYSAALQGVDAQIVTIEVNCMQGIQFTMVGLPDTAVKESHQRILSALTHNELKFPRRKTIVNLAPADIKKEGSAYDLPIAVGLLAASDSLNSDTLHNYLIMGELSLNGDILPIKGSLPITIKAKQDGYKGVIIPKANAFEAAAVQGIDVYGVENIKEVVEFFNNKITLQKTEIDIEKEFYNQQCNNDFDFDEVKGQESVKRAFEIAAAGGHNLIMIGAPGSGKSMLAKRIPSILPPLTLDESLETTKIHSVAGRQVERENSLITQRPFRAPHHTISSVALVGGGTYPQPGEISLAHNGVLFLDELPEFSRTVLEVMRQPLEDRKIVISRAKSTVEYPAGVMLIASMNPCPCGYYNHPSKECICSAGSALKYLNRISGPLLDRIDIQIEVIPVPFEKLSESKKGESSETIRKRVTAARAIQSARFANSKTIHCNAQMTPRQLAKYATPNADGLKILKVAMQRFSLSARAYDRILKLSRTIADLAASKDIEAIHIQEAITYRNLDRDSWGR